MPLREGDYPPHTIDPFLTENSVYIFIILHFTDLTL